MSSLQDEAYCFWPNGSVARDPSTGFPALPCDLSSAVSSCCLPGQQCDSQFQCQGPDGDLDNITPAACTLKDFSSDSCPCPQGLGVQTNCFDETICCGQNNESCCDKGLGVSSIIFNYASPLPSQSAAIEKYLASYTPASATEPAVTTFPPLPTITTTTFSSEATYSSPDGSSTGLSLGTKWGIAIGSICLFVLLFSGSVIFWAYRTNLRRIKQQQATKPSFQQSDWDTQLVGYELYGDVKHRPKMDVDTTTTATAYTSWGPPRQEMDGASQRQDSQTPERHGDSSWQQKPTAAVREGAMSPVELEGSSRPPIELE